MTEPSVTLYTITVDTEEEWDWDSGYPCENLALGNIAELPRFHETCARYGGKVTYFVDHAVLAEYCSRKTILDLARLPNAEIGMHIHPWNTPPISTNGRVPIRETFLHNLDPDQIRRKLESVYSLFLEHDIRPTSFRGGRYSTNELVQDFLQDRGFVADASVLPFTTWEDEGAPDYRSRRLLPVRRAPRRPDLQALWELPLTLGFTRRPFGLWHRLTELVAHSPLRHLHLIGIAQRLGIVSKAWLSFESSLGDQMIPFLRLLRRMRPPCINFTLHSSSLIVGGNPFARTADDRDRLLTRLNKTLAAISAWDDFRPATATEVARHLEQYHARSRN